MAGSRDSRQLITLCLEPRSRDWTGSGVAYHTSRPTPSDSLPFVWRVDFLVCYSLGPEPWAGKMVPLRLLPEMNSIRLMKLGVWLGVEPQTLGAQHTLCAGRPNQPSTLPQEGSGAKDV